MACCSIALVKMVKLGLAALCLMVAFQLHFTGAAESDRDKDSVRYSTRNRFNPGNIPPAEDDEAPLIGASTDERGATPGAPAPAAAAAAGAGGRGRNVNNAGGTGRVDGAAPAARTANRSASNQDCELHTMDPDIYGKITKLVKGGAKLLEYNIRFPEYNTNPLEANMTWNFKTSRWQRAFTKHGKTLLTLSFNYDVLSLSMLTFGVEEVDVPMVDYPKGCFGKFKEKKKLDKIMGIVMSDFRLFYKKKQWVGEFDHACHQVIVDDDGRASFEFRCCERVAEGGHIRCTNDLSIKWISFLFNLIILIKLAAFLIAPVFLQQWIYSESLRQANYVAKLRNLLAKTILVKKVRVPGDSSPIDEPEMKQFAKFRRIVKSIPSEEIIHVSFRKFQVQVDQRRLMTEKKVPVGLFLFIYEQLFRCGIKKFEPFASCCKESIFGSWSPKFLWLRLRKRSECNTSCRKYCSWGHFFNLLGGLLLLLAVPVPYYVRVAIYYAYEEPELKARRAAVKNVNLDNPLDHTLIHYADPSTAAMVMLYITYGASLLLLIAFRACNAHKFDTIAVGPIQDMRNIKRVECIRLIFAHLILPFEKFGFCGFLVGILYWPIAIPICVLVSICYFTPTLYLFGRFLIHRRPDFLRTRPMPTSPKRWRRHSKKKETLSYGTSSFETCLMLENISPENIDSKSERNGCFSCRPNRQACYTAFLSLVIGILCIIFMFSVLVMFSDVFGFAVEVVVFTLMGAIVNASSAAKYLMLWFWILMYSTACYNNVYNKYMNLNSKVFSYIKSKLQGDIKLVTMLREDMQKNTAFKYFNDEDLHELRDMEIEEEYDSDFESECDREQVAQNYSARGSSADSIEYIDDKLHWRIYSLIMFVDSKDVPRIPKELFLQICGIRAPGCPGPVHLSLLQATKQLMYMVLFLVFVIIIVMSFGDAYQLSSTNQLLVTLAGGFLPFVIRFVIQPKKANINLNTYSFEGKIHQIIRNFSQTWPVFDLSFRLDRTESANGMYSNPGGGPHGGGPPGGGPHGGGPPGGGPHGGGSPGGGPPESHGGPLDGSGGPVVPNPGGEGGPEGPSGHPTHVDLLITIRDDQDDNLHPEPGSFESRVSIPEHTLNRASPDDPGSSSYGINNPTNATALNRDQPERRRPQGSSLQSAGTQTGSGEFMSSTPSRTRPPTYTHTSTQVHTPPNGRPVDLMVDMVKGGFRVRNQTTNAPSEAERAPENGMPLWPRGSPYKRVPNLPGKDESSV